MQLRSMPLRLVSLMFMPPMAYVIECMPFNIISGLCHLLGLRSMSLICHISFIIMPLRPMSLRFMSHGAWCIMPMGCMPLRSILSNLCQSNL